jgi:hypothetical protein
MLYDSDIAFADALRREIDSILHGDKDQFGLYRTALLNTPDWEALQFEKGKIAAYEHTLTIMQLIMRRMSGETHKPFERV